MKVTADVQFTFLFNPVHDIIHTPPRLLENPEQGNQEPTMPKVNPAAEQAAGHSMPGARNASTRGFWECKHYH